MNKNYQHIRFLLSSLILLLGFQAQAGTTFCLGISPGNWSSTSSWICDTGSGIPETDTNVQIVSALILDVDATILNITIDPGADLDVAASAGGLTLQVNGDDVDLRNAQVDLSGDFNIVATNNPGQEVNLGEVNGPHNLNIVSTSQIEFLSPVGGTLPLNGIVTDTGSVLSVFADVSTSTDQTYNNDVRLFASSTMIGAVITFNGNVYSESGAADFDLYLDGDAVFNQDVGFGSLSPDESNRGDSFSLRNLTVNGTTNINSVGSAIITTAGSQEYFGAMTITADTTFTSTDGSLLRFWEDIDATGQHLAFNTTGTTQFTDAAFLGDVIIQAASVTTDAGGTTVIEYRADFQVNSDDTATTFNDAVRIGPSTFMEVNQTGAADTVFNDQVFQTSGGQKYLEVNDVSGQTIFNGPVLLGRIITNDGAGDDSTVINTTTFTVDQGASNEGSITFNDPVKIMQDMTIAETDAGSITFNNTLDAADGFFEVDLVINSDNVVSFGPIGTANAFYTLTTDAGGSSVLNGNTQSSFNLIFNDAVTLNQTTAMSAEVIYLYEAVNLQTFDLSLTGIDVISQGVISGSGGLISTLDGDLDLRGENTYSGVTRINNGDLSLASAPSQNNISASNEIFLTAGSTLFPPGFSFNFDLASGQTLSGDGTAAISLSALSGSVISPGDAAGTNTGDLSFTSLSMDTGSTYVAEINGLTPVTEYDQLSVSGINLDSSLGGGATLEVVMNTDINAGDQFMLVNTQGGNAVANTFNGLPEGGTVTASNGSQFNITYQGGDGNDVVLSGLCNGVITVSNDADSGPDTLRQAVLDVCPGGTINFAADLSITLVSEIELEADMTIDGSGQNVTLSGGGSNRIFNVDVGVAVNLYALNVNNGFDLGEGGGIISNGNLTIVDSTFDGHVSSSGPLGGGAIYNSNFGTLTVSESTFTNNLAGKGGAIFNDGGTLNIEISTFSQNGSNAGEGGAIHNRGTLIATNVTIAGNGQANTTGGGLMTWNGNQTLNNTLIADNNGSQDCYIELSNSSQSNSNSLIESGNCDAALTDDPQLQALANNGGNTQTMALALTSPAVDAGSDALCTVEDQRGLPRPQLAACDIGAYETEYLGIIHVDQNSQKRAGTCILGACWQNAYDNLIDALEVAGPTSQIWVAAGVYLPDVDSGGNSDDPSEAFEIPGEVSVYGGFAGTETALEQRDFNANLTVLSGDIDENDTDVNADGVIEAVADINGTNAYHVVDLSDPDVVLDGFTITAGFNDNGPPPARTGGGVECNTANSAGHVLSHLVLQGNWAEFSGGAMYGCNSTISNALFVNNESANNGGAATFTSQATPTLDQVSFIGNSAVNNGGAIVHQAIEMDRVYFAGNSAGGSGGALYASNVAVVTNSLFSGNAAGSDGGAVYLLAPSSFTNVTMTGNVAVGDGGAIYHLGGPVRGGNTAIENSIVWNNEDISGVGTVGASKSGGGDVIWSHSLVQGSGGSTAWNNAAGIDADNNIDLDPDFVQDVDLMAVPTVAGNARLTLGSAAIGSGNNAVVSTTEDLDGNARIDGGTVDMGAYEYGDLIFAHGFE
ncbi:choice-of-anchor Q domain-containing protein [Marinicella meishanensis]|uniref:choice-of-anchor Q domain-containing protein n=1 Tax=Marinicella meishanensis TaxID=2873263 RepID=UPI001CBC42DB|nr:choice-of-anchor Q domain-containing protein [Marinicella sp. NBU2979]